MRRSSYATPANGTERSKAAGRGRPLVAESGCRRPAADRQPTAYVGSRARRKEPGVPAVDPLRSYGNRNLMTLSRHPRGQATLTRFNETTTALQLIELSVGSLNRLLSSQLNSYATGTAPPSITCSVPLMALAREEARNSIRSATSPGHSIRPMEFRRASP
jgi:hypothetical protein